MTVPEIFAARGEKAFRAEESAVLAAACHRSSPAVVAVAGGAVLDAGNRALLARSGLVVWLRAEVDTLIRRVGDGSGRPLLDRDPAVALARLEIERRPFYTEVAGVVIDVDGVNRDEAVSGIVDAWAALASSRRRAARARL
ncbi:MAG: shikimate kinase, partial [Acidimicrobiales bacterium]